MERQPSPRKRIADGSLAILWVILAQFLMMGLDVTMSSSPFPFPSAILAMFLVFSVLLAVGYIWDGLAGFYDKFLRGPVSPPPNLVHLLLSRGRFSQYTDREHLKADLVNRHMSIGFSVPIVLLCRLPTAAPRTIGLIIACFCEEIARHGSRLRTMLTCDSGCRNHRNPRGIFFGFVSAEITGFMRWPYS